ncbi:MAG: winged helix-turn-helix transcriptional regulator [Candidatus Cloacimonetes bacterium]|nr:winged helix-turn-helix transcriptional regulator [Candidatus Cloacimonadota bacterium]
MSSAFDVISKNPDYTAEQIGKEINKTSRTVENYLQKLKQAGIIERKGPKLGGYWEVLK